MNLKPLFNAAQKFVMDNSPGILTGFAVAGAVTTAVLAGKAGYSAALIIRDELDERSSRPGNYAETYVDLLPPKERLQLVWKEFIPAATVGVTTITCVIGATQISTRRTAAIAAAFKLSEELAAEYKDRVVKTLGAKKEEDMRAELAQDRMTRTGGGDTVIIVGSEVLFYDELTGRFFKNEMERIRQAINEINHQINNFYHASLTEFYEKIGLSGTVFSDEVGWNSDELLDVQFSATLLEGKPAVALSFRTTPIRGYDRCH
jgi:hypothetical protein